MPEPFQLFRNFVNQIYSEGPLACAREFFLVHAPQLLTNYL